MMCCTDIFLHVGGTRLFDKTMVYVTLIIKNRETASERLDATAVIK